LLGGLPGVGRYADSKIDTVTGGEGWFQHHLYDFAVDERGVAIDAWDDGLIVYAGVHSSDGNPTDILLRVVSDDPATYDDNGTHIQWEYKWDLGAQGFENAIDVAAADDGTIYVLADALVDGESFNILVAQVDPEIDPEQNDPVIWSWQYNDVDINGQERASDMALAPDGSVVVVGSVMTEFYRQPFVAKLSSDGVLQWSHAYESVAFGDENGAHENAAQVEIDADGNILVFASVNDGAAPDFEFATQLLQYDPDGTLSWESPLFVNDEDVPPSPVDMQLAPDGDLYITVTHDTQSTHVIRWTPGEDEPAWTAPHRGVVDGMLCIPEDGQVRLFDNANRSFLLVP
jgi:hypothetical protein